MEQDNITVKECNRCHRTLPVTEFYKKKGTSDGLQYVCKACTSELNKAARRNKKAFGTQRALLRLVGKRGRLLDYLMAKDSERYSEIVKALGLRK